MPAAKRVGAMNTREALYISSTESTTTGEVNVLFVDCRQRRCRIVTHNIKFYVGNGLLEYWEDIDQEPEQ